MDDFGPITSNSLVFAGPYWGSLEWEIVYWMPHVRWLKNYLQGRHFSVASYPDRFPLYLGVADEFYGLPDEFVGHEYETQFFEALCDQSEYAKLLNAFGPNQFANRFKKLEFVRSPRANYKILRKKNQLKYSKLICTTKAAEDFDKQNVNGGRKPIIAIAANSANRSKLLFDPVKMIHRKRLDDEYVKLWPNEYWIELFDHISQAFGDRLSLVDITDVDLDMQIAALKKSMCSVLPDNDLAVLSLHAGCPSFIYGKSSDRLFAEGMNPFDTDVVFYESTKGEFNEPSELVFPDAKLFIEECLSKAKAITTVNPIKGNSKIKTVGIIGNMSDIESTNVSLSKAFMNLGYKTDIMPYRQAVQQIGVAEANQDIINNAHNYDLIIFCKNNGADPHVIRECSKRGAITLWYMMDSIDHVKNNPVYYQVAEAADICVVTSGAMKHALLEYNKNIIVHHVLQGVDEKRYFPIKNDDIEKPIDFLFIGLKSERRERILNTIRGFGFKVEAHGPGYDGYVNADNFNRLCSMAKVCLAINNTDPSIDSFSDRILRYLSCGAFVWAEASKDLHKYIDDKFVPSFLEENLDVGYLEWILKCSASCKINGRDLILQNHTWSHVAEKMIGFAEAHQAWESVTPIAKTSNEHLSIGFVSQWYPRGQTYVTKTLINAISSPDRPFLLARSASNEKAILSFQDDLAYQHIAEISPTYHIDPAVFKHWIDQREIDVIFFNEEPQWELVRIAKERGIKTVGYFVWELFDPKWADYVNSHYDLVICPTKCSYDTFKNEYGINNAKYLQWAIDPDFYIEFSNILPNQNGIVFFHPAGWGGLHERRGTQYVIDAFIKANIDNAILHIHTQKDSHAYQIDDLNNRIVIDCGNVERHILKSFYENSDVVVLPSLWEGLGLTFLEAIGCGKPIITTDAPPMNEFVEDDSGIRCPGERIVSFKDIFIPGIIPDVDGIAEAMNWFVEDDHLEYARKQTLELRKKYKFEGFRQRLLGLIKDMIMEA